jgi:NADPH:quinone reductase-like Zn-dependent oxidoreductase
LVEENVPQPQPRRGELLIRVYAAGVTSKELLWYPTTHNKTAKNVATPYRDMSFPASLLLRVMIMPASMSARKFSRGRAGD